MIEIARRLASLGQKEEAVKTYVLALQQDCEPSEILEAAAFILQFGGDYRISYTCFQELYNQGHFRNEILPLMTKVFYEPNIKLLKGRYERNCKLLRRYPYFFRKDFLPFEELPIQFFPYDEHSGYVPFYKKEERFGDFVNFENTVVSRNFFRDLEKPILADDVYSQYELEYLNDNVRSSEDIGRENHVYLHYTHWETFCAYLQCLNLRPLLDSKKLVFLIEDEIGQYPIDFKERFGIDYSTFSTKPIRIREISRLIWHTQLSTHNGGDFFNEIFDYHPNLLALPSVMMSNIEKNVSAIRDVLSNVGSLREFTEAYKNWEKPQILEELYRMRGRTDKDIFVAMFLALDTSTEGLDPNSRIAPAVFFQPHFHNVVYQMRVNSANDTVLEAENYETVHKSSIFRNFKYIKTFTPMRRFTTSHGATVRFMYLSSKEQITDDEDDGKKTVVSDAISERIVNRSFMIDPEDRLYKDSVLVRFEDGKLNPKATFTALASFLDLPYTESMTYCSENNVRDPHPDTKGFDPAPVYKTYDDFVNDSERYFIEYFLRDAYEYYGYDFQYYDGAEVDEKKAIELIENFTTIDHYIRESWEPVYDEAEITRDGERINSDLEQYMRKDLLDRHMAAITRNRVENTKILLEGLRFVNKRGQPLRMMPKLELDPALLEQPLYH